MFDFINRVLGEMILWQDKVHWWFRSKPDIRNLLNIKERE